MGQLRFELEDDCEITIKVNKFKDDDYYAWTEICDQFLIFLKGCGYSVDSDKIGKYFVEGE